MKKYILVAVLMITSLLSAEGSPRPYEPEFDEYDSKKTVSPQGKPGERDDGGYLRPGGKDDNIIDPAL